MYLRIPINIEKQRNESRALNSGGHWSGVILIRIDREWRFTPEEYTIKADSRCGNLQKQPRGLQNTKKSPSPHPMWGGAELGLWGCCFNILDEDYVMFCLSGWVWIVLVACGACTILRMDGFRPPKCRVLQHYHFSPCMIDWQRWAAPDLMHLIAENRQVSFTTLRH